MRRALALPFSGLQCGRASSVFSVRYLLLLASLFPSHVFSSSSDGHQRLYQHYQSHLNIKLLYFMDSQMEQPRTQFPPVPVAVFLDEDEERLTEYCYSATAVERGISSGDANGESAPAKHQVIQHPLPRIVRFNNVKAFGDEHLVADEEDDALYGGSSATTRNWSLRGLTDGSGETSAAVAEVDVESITRITTAASSAPPTVAVGDLVRHVEKNCRGVVRYIGPMYQVCFEGVPADDARRRHIYTAHEAAEWVTWNHQVQRLAANAEVAQSSQWVEYSSEMKERYRGVYFTVPDPHAVWFGVHWEKSAGKGNGTVQGVAYMPAAGSVWPEGSVECDVGFGSMLKRNKFRTQKSLLRALFQRFTYGGDATNPDAILRPCASMFYRDNISPSKPKPISNDEVPVGGPSSAQAGAVQHKGFCRRTHGLDPFVRNDLTGQFTNVLITDCSANESLQSVGFGNEKFVSVQYTKFMMRTRRISCAQPPENPSEDASIAACIAASLEAPQEVLLDLRLSVVTPSVVLDGSEAGVPLTPADELRRASRKYVHQPPHVLLTERDVLNASFLHDCFVQAITGSGTVARLGGSDHRVAHNAATNTYILSRSERKKEAHSIISAPRASDEDYPPPCQPPRTLATAASSASMTATSPVTPFGVVTGANTLPPHVEGMLQDEEGEEPATPAETGGLRLVPVGDHRRHPMLFQQAKSSASSPLINGCGASGPSAFYRDPTSGLLAVDEDDQQFRDRHNLLLLAADKVDEVMGEAAIHDEELAHKTATVLPSPSAFERCFSLHYLFPNLSTLSVANTLIQCWADLWDIVVSFPLLRVLNASGNPMRPLGTADILHLYETYHRRTAHDDVSSSADVSPSKRESAGLDSARQRLNAKSSDRVLPNLTSLAVSDTGLTAEMFVLLTSLFPNVSMLSVGSNAPEATKSSFNRLASGEKAFSEASCATPYPHKSFLHPGNMAAAIASLFSHATEVNEGWIADSMLRAAARTLCYSVDTLGVSQMDFTIDTNDSCSPTDKWAPLRSCVEGLHAALGDHKATLQPLLTTLCLLDGRPRSSLTPSVVAEATDTVSPLYHSAVPPLDTSDGPCGYYAVLCPDRPTLTRIQVSGCPIRSLGYSSVLAVVDAERLLDAALGSSPTPTVSCAKASVDSPFRLPALSFLLDTVESVLAKGCLFSSWDEAFLCFHHSSTATPQLSNADPTTLGGPSSDFHFTGGLTFPPQLLVRRRCFPRVTDLMLTDCPAVDSCGQDVGNQRRHQVCCFPLPPAQGPPTLTNNKASPLSDSGTLLTGKASDSPLRMSATCPLPADLTILRVAFVDKLNKSSVTKIERTSGERHAIKQHGDWYYSTVYPLVKAATVELAVMLTRHIHRIAHEGKPSAATVPLPVLSLPTETRERLGDGAARYWRSMQELGGLLERLPLPPSSSGSTIDKQRTLRTLASKINLCVKGFLLDKASAFGEFLATYKDALPQTGLTLLALFEAFLGMPGRGSSRTIPLSMWLEVCGGGVGPAATNDGFAASTNHEDVNEEGESDSSSDESERDATHHQSQNADSPERGVRKSRKPCVVEIGAVSSPLTLIEEACVATHHVLNGSSHEQQQPPPPMCWLPQIRRLAIEAISEVFNDMCAVAEGSVSVDDLIEDEIFSNKGNNFRRLGGRVGPAVVQAPPKPLGPRIAINEIDVEFTTVLLTPEEFLAARACAFHDTVNQHLAVSKSKRRQRRAKLKEELEGGTIPSRPAPTLTPAMLQQMGNDVDEEGRARIGHSRSAAVLSSTDDGGSTSVGTGTTVAAAIAAGLVDPLSSRKIDPMFEATIDLRWTSKQLQSHLCQQAHLPDVSPYSKENLAAAAAAEADNGDLTRTNVIPKRFLHDDVVSEEDHWSVASLTIYMYLYRIGSVLKNNNAVSTATAFENTGRSRDMQTAVDNDGVVGKTTSAVKEVLRVFPLSGENPAGRKFPPAQYMFPKGCVFMFHVSRELLKSEGAVSKGMHCADMIRGEDRLQRFRISPRDIFVLVLIV